MIQEFFEYLDDLVNARSEKVNTCLPAQVTAYYPDAQRIDALPCLKRPMRTENDGLADEDLPELFDIPFAFPRVGNSILHMPPQVGDYVLLLVPQWSISEWYRKGDSQVSVGDMAHHSLGSLIATYGISPETKIVSGLSATDILIGSHKTGIEAGPSIRFTSVKTILGMNQATTKGVARIGDSVSVTIPMGAIVSAVAGASATGPGAPVMVTGTITGGSMTVEAGD